MKTKTVEKTDFQQKLNEKLQAASERQLEKMAPAKPTVTEKKKPGRKAKNKLTDEEKRELHKQKCKEHREKKKQEKLIEIRKEENEANDARAYAAAQVTPEWNDKPAAATTEQPKAPEQRKNLFELIKEHFDGNRPATIYKTEVERILDEGNKHFKRVIGFYTTLLETKDAIIEEQHRQLDRLNTELNNMIQQHRRNEKEA